MGSVEELKQAIKALSEQRSQAEITTSDCSARLQAAGVGLHERLVDSEGFPRADIDIPAIRADRHKVITLNNDAKELTNQIEILIHRLHAITRQPGGPTFTALPPPSGAAELEAASMHVAAPIAVPSASVHPFAAVDELSPDSPATAAGVQLHDELVRFGHITGQTPNPLQAVARLLMESEGGQVESEWLRGGERVRLVLHPQRWTGRGLLGCHLQPQR